MGQSKAVTTAFLIRTLLVLLLPWGLSTPGHARNTPKSCPDSSAGETAEDCPWARYARALSDEAKAGRNPSELLKSLAPEFYSNLISDSKLEAWKNLWGQSINYDEFAKGIIVAPVIMDSLETIFGIPKHLKGSSNEAHRVHAGLEHTYGYLFSTLKTPFGFKRARWIRGEIEAGFGLPKGVLGPIPSDGTLFSNATYFLGQIAFRGEPEKLRILKKERTAVSLPIRKFSYRKLNPVRLEEEVEAKIGEITRTVNIRTDLVPFLLQSDQSADQPDRNTHLLIYSVADPGKGGARLITAFPVQSSFVKKVTDSKELGKRPVITRYNGYVEGVTGASLIGQRHFLSKVKTK